MNNRRESNIRLREDGQWVCHVTDAKCCFRNCPKTATHARVIRSEYMTHPAYVSASFYCAEHIEKKYPSGLNATQRQQEFKL